MLLFETSRPIEEDNSSDVNNKTKEIQSSFKHHQDTIKKKEMDHRVIARSLRHESSSIQVCAGLDSLETADNLLKHQLGAQNSEPI